MSNYPMSHVGKVLDTIDLEAVVPNDGDKATLYARSGKGKIHKFRAECFSGYIYSVRTSSMEPRLRRYVVGQSGCSMSRYRPKLRLIAPVDEATSECCKHCFPELKAPSQKGQQGPQDWDGLTAALDGQLSEAQLVAFDVLQQYGEDAPDLQYLVRKAGTQTYWCPQWGELRDARTYRTLGRARGAAANAKGHWGTQKDDDIEIVKAVLTVVGDPIPYGSKK